MYPIPTPEGDRLIETGTGYNIIQIGHARLEEFTEFVFENFVRGLGRHQVWKPCALDYTIMLAEERALFKTGIYVVAQSSKGHPLAALRVARWPENAYLKTERVFQIRLSSLAHEWQVNQRAIWHFSQLCIDHAAIQRLDLPASSGIRIMRGIFRCMLYAGKHFEARYGIMEIDDQISAYLSRFMSIHPRRFTAIREYFGRTYVARIDIDAVRKLSYTRMGNDISR